MLIWEKLKMNRSLWRWQLKDKCFIITVTLHPRNRIIRATSQNPLSWLKRAFCYKQARAWKAGICRKRANQGVILTTFVKSLFTVTACVDSLKVIFKTCFFPGYLWEMFKKLMSILTRTLYSWVHFKQKLGFLWCLSHSFETKLNILGSTVCSLQSYMHFSDLILFYLS